MWCTLELKEPHETDCWQDLETGDQIVWHSPEHAVLLIGLEGPNVIVNDPHTASTENYNKELFELRWKQMGSQAVSIR